MIEKQRAAMVSAGMVACHGRVQREGEVVHVVMDRIEDLTPLLRTVRAEGAPEEDFVGSSTRQEIGVGARDFR
nr:hypothetical protein [Endobacter medicaginis]